MQVIETTIYYYWYRSKYHTEPVLEVRISDYLKDDEDYVLFDQKLVKHEIPDEPDMKKMTLQQIENLKLKKAKVLGEAYAESVEIDERIQSYLALENKTEITVGEEDDLSI